MVGVGLLVVLRVVLAQIRVPQVGACSKGPSRLILLLWFSVHVVMYDGSIRSSFSHRTCIVDLLKIELSLYQLCTIVYVFL